MVTGIEWCSTPATWGETRFENVVDTAALVASHSDDDLLFVLLGDGNARRELERRAAGVPTIRFMDPLPDEEFRVALRCADVLLVNERVGVKEMAVPSKLTTYFASGTPVVAAVDRQGNYSPGDRVDRHGRRGASGDPDALASSIRSLLDDRAMCAQITLAAERHCIDNLSSQAAGDGLNAGSGFSLQVRRRVERSSSRCVFCRW